MTASYLCDGVTVAFESFANLNPTKIRTVVEFVKHNIDSISDAPKNNLVIIEKSPFGYPKCMRLANGMAMIWIDARGDDEYQWLYQFAHEYMHHFIGSDLSGMKLGLWWFEEIICCASSLYHISQWSSHFHRCLNTIPTGQKSPRLMDPNVLRLLWHQPTKSLESLREDIQPPLCVLSPSVEYNAEEYVYYESAARGLLPLFQGYPQLWRIALCMSDMKNWPDMRSFLAHIRSNIASEKDDCSFPLSVLEYLFT